MKKKQNIKIRNGIIRRIGPPPLPPRIKEPIPVQINNNSPMYMPLSLYDKCLKINDSDLTLYYNLLGVDDSIPSEISVNIKKLENSQLNRNIIIEPILIIENGYKLV